MPIEPLVCPLCGAPYRNVIPSDVAQVRCKYCGGTIIVPSGVPRCPNHPDVLALGLCNDCSTRFCRACLTNYVLEGRQEGGVLYLCPNCLKRRFLSKAESQVLLGVMFLIMGAIVAIISPLVGLAWIAVVAVPIAVYSVYKTRRIRQEVEVYSSPEEVAGNLVNEEVRFAYRDLLVKYMRMFGPIHGTLIFERQIERCMNAGLSREEAVRKLALEEGFI